MVHELPAGHELITGLAAESINAPPCQPANPVPDRIDQTTAWSPLIWPMVQHWTIRSVPANSSSSR